MELRGGQVEDVHVICGAEIQPLALLVVKNKFVQGGLRENLRGLRVLKRTRGGRCSRGGSDSDVGLAGGSGRSQQHDALQRERICGAESERRSNGRDILDFLYDRSSAADLYGDLRCVGGKTVAIDLNCVATGFGACVGQNFQNLWAVAEGVGGDGQPATREKRSDVDGTVYDAWRSRDLNLSRADGSGSPELPAKFDLGTGLEVLADEKRCGASGERPLRRLSSRRRRKRWDQCGERAGFRGINEADAAIGNCEEQLRLIGLFDF